MLSIKHFYQEIQEASHWITKCISSIGLKRCQMCWHCLSAEKLQLYSWKQGDGKEVIPSALLKEKLPVFSSRKGMAEVATELYSTLSLISHCSCGQPNASFLLQTFIITVEKWQIGNNRTMLKCLRLWYCSNLTIKEKSVSSHKHRRNSHPKNGVS